MSTLLCAPCALTLTLAVLLCLAPAAVQAQSTATVAGGTAAAASDSAGAGQASEGRGIRVTWRDRPSIRFGEIARVDLKVRFQLDSRDSDVPLGPDESATSWARRRIGAEAELAGLFGAQVEYELGGDDPWRDVFINYQQFEFAQLRAGKFKIPFGLDEQTSAARLDFVERSRVSDQLAPGRDRGVMLHGRVFKRILGYELGVFDHDGRNARRPDTDRVSGGRTVAARVMAQPLRTGSSIGRTLQLAAAMVRTEVIEGFSAIRGQTAFGHEFYEPDYWVLGAQRRRGFEALWRPGPFSVKSEYIRLTTERLGQSVEDGDLSPLQAVGWYVSGTWAVTGERKADGLDVPKRPLTSGGPGAIEVAARVESLEFSSVATGEPPSTSPRADVVWGNRLRAMTVGVNWHPVRWVRVQFNLIREAIEDPDQGPLPAQPAFWSRVLRLQFAF